MRAWLPVLLVLLLGCKPEPSTEVELPDDDDAADDDAGDDDAGDDDAADDDAADDDAADDDAADDDAADDDAGDDDAGDDDAGDDDSAAVPLSPYEACFAEFLDPASPGPGYDQYGYVMGSHCQGTDHQDITGVERVVFLGDSVTVGTPPSTDPELYRSILTQDLAAEFWLSEPGLPWPGVDLFNGVAYDAWIDQGDFQSCAKWGARVDDLYADNNQILDCMPLVERDKQHLVVMTMGGNDIASLTQHGAEGMATADLWLQVDEWVQDFEDAIAFLMDPLEFPVRPYVIFGNNFEFTDGTGDVESCAFAGLADFSNDQWQDPTAQEEMILYVMEQYLRIAVDYQVDMVFMLENFCGHGFRRDDPDGRCFRGPDAELWFDLTCIHPNPTGHAVIADMFLQTVQE